VEDERYPRARSDPGHEVGDAPDVGGTGGEEVQEAARGGHHRLHPRGRAASNERDGMGGSLEIVAMWVAGKESSLKHVGSWNGIAALSKHLAVKPRGVVVR